jgi:hypothetical protein
MPTKIGDVSSSRGLVPQTTYTHLPSGEKRPTRAEESSVEWSIAVSGGVTYLIRFSSNFFKKHLHTSTKKLANVQAEYDKLGSITDEDARWQAAQDAADEGKFHRQLKHRSRDEQDCDDCGHSIKEHKVAGSCSRVTKKLEFPSGYTPGDKDAKGKPIKKSEVAYACTCKGYLAPYEKARGVQGKPTLNPLLGATAQTNDLIWMDKIPRATFEKVIQEAIQKRYAAVVPAPGWSADGEHIEWDFGAANRGCILKFDANTKLADAKAKGYSCVNVKMTLDNTDPKKPVFTACHLDGSKTK